MKVSKIVHTITIKHYISHVTLSAHQRLWKKRGDCTCGKSWLSLGDNQSEVNDLNHHVNFSANERATVIKIEKTPEEELNTFPCGGSNNSWGRI